MGIFDSMLAQMGCELNAAAIGAKLGWPADRVERAIAALGVTHTQPGETIAAAAVSSGMRPAELSQIIEELGGESGLSRLSAILGRGDRSSPVTDHLDDFFGSYGASAIQHSQQESDHGHC